MGATCEWCGGAVPESRIARGAACARFCGTRCGADARYWGKQGKTYAEVRAFRERGYPPRPCATCKADFVPTSLRAMSCNAPECRKVVKAAWGKSPKGRAKSREACKAYRSSPEGRAVRLALNRRLRAEKPEHYRAKSREGRKRYYARKKADGLCVRPGCWEGAAEGHVMCRACLLELREAHRKEKGAA